MKNIETLKTINFGYRAENRIQVCITLSVSVYISH